MTDREAVQYIDWWKDNSIAFTIEGDELGWSIEVNKRTKYNGTLKSCLEQLSENYTLGSIVKEKSLNPEKQLTDSENCLATLEFIRQKYSITINRLSFPREPIALLMKISKTKISYISIGDDLCQVVNNIMFPESRIEK